MAKGSQLLTVLCILSIVVLFAVGPSGTPTLVAASPPNSPYSGSGATSDAYEFARNASTLFTNGANNTAFTYYGNWFPSGYRGYHLSADISNLRRTQDPVPNGGFEKGLTNWSLVENNGGIVKSVSNSTGGNPGQCLNVELKGGNVPAGAKARIENSFSYTSSIQPDSLVLSFDIKFSADITQTNKLLVKVSVVYQAAEISSWSNTTNLYHPTTWDHHSFNTGPVNGSVTLRITIQRQGSGNANLNGRIYFDNFRYQIGTDSKPSEVALKLNSVAVANGVGNAGAVSIYVDSSKKEEATWASCWSTNQVFQFNSTYTISFDYAYSMYVKRETLGGATTTFSAPVDGIPTWQINYTVPSGRPPSGHTSYSYAVYLRTGWGLTSVKNSTGQDYPYSYNSTTLFVKLGDISNPVGKTFSIYASALNYVLQVFLQKGPTASGPWTNLSAGGYFVKNDWLRVMATLRPIGPTGNYANVSIFYPDMTLWQSARSSAPVEVWFHDGNDTLTSKAWQVPAISESRAGSNWLATVSFNTTTQCGMRQQSFAVAIGTSATRISPSSGTRVIWGQTVPVNVTWQNVDNLAYVTDASARVRYVDRYLQVQYVTMTANGQGAYSTQLSTNLMAPNLYAQFQVELFRYGYVNASYALGTHLTFTINLVNDINYEMVRPTQQTGPDQFTGETSRSQGYTSEVKFYDPYQGTYVLNGTSIWPNAMVNYSRYEDSGSGWEGPIVQGTFAHNTTTRSFYKYDANYGVGIQRVKYTATMRVLDASWEYEQQNFTIVIIIVSHATDLDALRTTIRYPPSGTGNGWVYYDNVSDNYEPHVYWKESFNVTVLYLNQSTSLGITGATVRILIGANLYSLTSRGNGYYNYTLGTTSLSPGTYYLQVNATYIDHAAQTILIKLIVSTRITELTKNPPTTIIERPWNDSFAAIFTFLDIVNPASPLPIIGATVNVTGYVAGKYSIQDMGNGSYLITFQGGVTEATYGITARFTYTNYITRTQYFELTIRRIHTECSGEAVTVSVPWGDNVTILLAFKDTDHGFLTISSATLAFAWQNGIQGVDYWIQSNPNGTYTIFLNTTKVAAGTWPFTITFSASKTHYDTAQVMVSFQVRNVLTVLYRTSIQPGTSVPWGDVLTFVFTYNDTDRGFRPIAGATISCDWDQFYWSYSYNATTGGYVVTIHTESRLEGSYTLHIVVQKTHYQSFTTVEGFVLRQVQTSYSAHPTLYFPTHYWGENLTVGIEYLDLDHSGTILYAGVTTNWDSGFYTIYYFDNGTYTLVFNTTSRSVGSHQIRITLSRVHFTNQTILVSLTLIPVSLIVEVVSEQQVTAEYGDAVVVTVRITEDLYGRTINVSTTTFHWLGGSGTMTFLGAGIYNVTFPANGDTGTYVVTVQANSTGYQLGIGYVLLYILPTETDLDLLTSSIEVVVGESFTISVNFTTLQGVGISNATVTYVWASPPRSGLFLHIVAGVWNATLVSSGLEAGQYSVYITAGGPNVVEQRRILRVYLTVIPTELVPTPVVQDVYFGETLTVLVYFNDTHHNLPITGANILFYWGAMNGSFIETGTPGFYNISLPSIIFPVGDYDLTLQVDLEGYRACLESVLVHIRAQPTHLVLVQAESQYTSDHGPIVISLAGTYWRVPRGDTLCLYFSFTDNSNQTLIGATGVYAWDYGSGVLEYVGGFYVARINLTGISPGFYYPTISLSRQNYETGYGPLMQLEVILTPTEIVIEPGQLSYFTGQVFSLTMTLNDTYHNATIRGAQLTASILALGRLDIPLVDNGDGTYTLRDISIPTEGTFVISIDAEGGLKYAAAHHEFTIVVTLHPVTRNLATIGALAALIIVIAIAGWLIYARVFAVPWLVRKMRGMARKIGKGETPGLSKADRAKIPARPDQLSSMAEPFYEKAGVSMPKAVLYPMAQLDEKASEDEAIWQQLKDLPNLELEQKSQLFAEMKKIPANERVWFVQDLKKQMADGTRFARKTKKAEAPKIAPEIEQEIRARLAAFPTLAKEEKDRLFRQLSGLPKVEWDAVFVALAESGKIAKPEPSKALPDELPALTEEERAKLLRDLEGLSPEEREKVLKTLKAKHAEVNNESTERKPPKEKRKGADDESKKTEEKKN